jgi:signal transduction histidine kinase
MPLSPETKARSGLILIFSLSVGLLTAHIVHAVGADEDIRTFLLGILIPMLFTVGVFSGGLWLWRQPVDGWFVLRVGTWCLVGSAVLLIMAGLTILYQWAEGVLISDRLYVLLNATSGGAVVGFVVGLYDGRQRRARTELNRLSQQLTVLNRVLRHDIRNSANVIRGNAELLTDEQDVEFDEAQAIKQRAASLVKIGNQAKEIEQLLQESDTARTVVDVAELARQCCAQVSQEYPTAEFEVVSADSLLISAHPLVESALLNVIENGVEHNDTPSPSVTITFDTVSAGATEFVEIRVADNGPGIPEGETAVLERGYETDLDHLSGLSLWLVNWIVTNSDGDVRFDTDGSDGGVVCLRFERAHTYESTTPTASGERTVSQPPSRQRPN